MNLFDDMQHAQPSAESVVRREVAMRAIAHTTSVESTDELELNDDVTADHLQRGEAVMSEVNQIIHEPEVSVEALVCAHDLTRIYQTKFFKKAQLQGLMSFSTEDVSSRRQSISAESVRDGVRATLSLVQKAAAKLAA